MTYQGGGWTRGTHCLPSTFARSNPCDFFLWGHLKLLVYATSVDNTPENLIAQIVVAAADIKSISGIFEHVRESFLRRCRLCNGASGLHLQQLL
ncbi:hypothetical protein AVEN_21625-1 [Araneus ventricosus]|uniref:Uncharacterized protein n=1 Tax=Araneus ventricosus TaxID=182803 RepID=A0A4Y2G819_ARAVE|nr:hypothetical protein AVEN_21625-1 [Araneus ventricosus]